MQAFCWWNLCSVNGRPRRLTLPWWCAQWGHKFVTKGWWQCVHVPLECPTCTGRLAVAIGGLGDACRGAKPDSGSGTNILCTPAQPWHTSLGLFGSELIHWGSWCSRVHKLKFLLLAPLLHPGPQLGHIMQWTPCQHRQMLFVGWHLLGHK